MREIRCRREHCRSLFRTYLALAGLVLFLGACALQNDVSDAALKDAGQAERALKNTPDCCSGLSDLGYEPIPLSAIEEQVGVEKELGSATPVHQFDDGRSYFLAWSLPATSRGLTLEVRSLPTETTLFMPKVLLLDEQYQLVRSIDGSSFSFIYGSLLDTDRLEANAEIEAAENVRYIVLYSPATRGESTATLLPVPTGRVLVRLGYLTAEE